MGRAGCAGLVLGARDRPPAGGAHRYTGAARPTCTLRVPLARAGTPLKTPASWSWHSRPPFFEVFPRFRLGQATGGSETEQQGFCTPTRVLCSVKSCLPRISLEKPWCVSPLPVRGPSSCLLVDLHVLLRGSSSPVCVLRGGPQPGPCLHKTSCGLSQNLSQPAGETRGRRSDPERL